MKKREFNRVLKDITTTRKKIKLLDKHLATSLPDETKLQLINYLVRNRAPILKEFLTNMVDGRWLSCCGYSYGYENNGYCFVGTIDHFVRFKRVRPDTRDMIDVNR